MTEAHKASTIAGQQDSTAVLLEALLGFDADPLMKAHADMLVKFETAVTHWLHRRQEAVVNTRQLVARLQASSNPSEVLKAQQDWVTAAVHLLAADATAYHSASLQLMERARSLVQQAARTTERVVPPAAAAPRAATKPYRLFARAE